MIHKRLFILLIGSMSVSFIQAQDLADTITDSHILKEVTVSGQSARNRVTNSKLGTESIDLSKIAFTPKMFGEVDIIKSITLLPGIKSESDGVGGFEVRGGTAYQNLVTMDGMTLYNPAHMMGIFSTFNEDAINRAVLHKGPIPACYGEASSSVLETTMKSGDLEDYHFSGMIGLLNAKLAIDGPIVKDKLSFAVSARRSYVDMFLNVVPKYRDNVMNFYDINAKLKYNVNNRNIIDASFFKSKDNLAISDLMSMKWGNTAGHIGWTSYMGSSWKLNTSLALTHYTTDMGTDIMDANQTLTEYIRNYSFSEKATFNITDAQTLEFGLNSAFFGVKSGDMVIREVRQREIHSGWHNAVWFSYDASCSPYFTMSLGSRLSSYSALSGDKFHKFEALDEDAPDYSSKNYVYFEPRISAKYSINALHNIKVGASISTQNIHGVRSTTTTFPFDRYALSSANVKPEKTTQYSVGYAGMKSDGAYDWNIESYYKAMDNVYDYLDGVTMFSRINLESLILRGKGRSYGLEVMFRKNTGKLTGWVAYTLSKTESKIPGINDGKWYKSSNDRRHDIAIVGIYQLNKYLQLSSSWTLATGRPITAPDEKYQLGGTTCYYYTHRNSYSTPTSHRLDISATYTKVGKRFTSIWSFGIFNVYAHYSPFVIYFEDDSSKPSGTRAVQQSLFGIVPSVSYTIKF